jgi:deaminated glutathione amidase
MYSAMRDMGADILLVPSAFTYKTGLAHWEILLRARAIENQCYVVAAAQCGRHNEKRESYGQTMIIDPWGNILAQCRPHKPSDEAESFAQGQEKSGCSTLESICYAVFDRATLDKIRESMPVNDHKRKDLYDLKSKL